MRFSSHFSSRTHANLIYTGVAIASGGVALYTPLIVSQTGLKFSGFWAASILFGLNLGRVAGAWLGTRFPVIANHPFSVSGNILLEGIALYCLAFLDQAWALALFATIAGLGSGLSFPGLKFFLLKLRDLDQSALFARLSMSIRLGLVAGYLLAGWIPHDTMQLVFLIVLLTFTGYGILMLIAMRGIVQKEQLSADPESLHGHPAQQVHAQFSPRAVNPQADLPWLFYVSNAVFWCLAMQPNISLSLHIPHFTPSIPVSTPFWVGALVIIALQMPVSKLAVRDQDHFRFLRFGYLGLLAGFATLVCFPQSAAAVIAAAVFISFGQIFYGPSLDVLTARFADKTNADTGRLMSRQMLYQSSGSMAGSLSGGILFDLAQRLQLPVLNWAALATLALVMCWYSYRKIPALYKQAVHSQRQ
ncbi:MFS transporter [Undibacterium squillarum]|uniref:MFS transporter n=1 Tax=Undibacterium squillarum TaxID=1131567 RepID=UPI0035AE1F19